MNIAIIGSSSFLGKNIVNSLSENIFNLELFSRKKGPLQLKWHEYNFPNHLLQYDSLLKYDIIYYCVGAGIQPGNVDTPSLIKELNLNEPIKLIQALNEKKYKGKFISFGSYFEIGNSPIEKKYSENDLIDHKNILVTDYSKAKHELTKLISNLL